MPTAPTVCWQKATPQPQKQKNVKLGIGQTKSLGSATCSFPIEHFWFTIKVYIVDADVPLLLSLADMDRLGLAYDNVVDVLIHKESGAQAPMQRNFGHPILIWSRNLVCFFNISELNRLHRRFGHPAAEKLHNLLRRARPTDVTRNTLRHLKQIARECNLCQFQTARPHRFKFTIRDDKQFNQSIYVDIMTLERKPVLHIVDEATRYQAARWLPSVSSASIWRALRLAWIDTYLGPPNVIGTDASNALTLDAFRIDANLFHVDTKDVPVEAANTMNVVERYHEPLRRAYRIVRSECRALATGKTGQCPGSKPAVAV